MRQLLLVLALSGCGTVDEGDLDAGVDGAVAPDADVDAPQVDAPPPIDAFVPPDGFTCEAGAFLTCSGNTLARCNATGDGVDNEDCASGCNMAAARCNQCVPSSMICDGAVLETCDADGLPLPDESCAAGCEPAPAPHCRYLEPIYLANACDAKATTSPFVAPSGSSTLDSGVDLTCTGGLNGTICVIRHPTFDVPSGRTLKIVGSRRVAIVSDGLLNIGGVLDVAAEGTTSGPGGGIRTSGATAGSVGGGGAGFKSAGGSGGGASNGGPIFTPTPPTLSGGARSSSSGMVFGPPGGGGGGTVLLISCRGEVAVPAGGVIDAGGGGGVGGFDQLAGGTIDYVSAAGGGSGGYVVFEGVTVRILGSLYANGGGGGSGCSGNECTGTAGGNGNRSATSAAAGGPAVGTGGAGGNGGVGGTSPGNGVAGASTNDGGGGGSVGRFQLYLPAGTTATYAPSAASPSREVDGTVPLE